MTSQQMDVQYWDGSQYNNLTTMIYSGNVSSTTVTFPLITTQRLRFWQPAGQGPPSYPGILWITEADYSSGSTAYFGDLNNDLKVDISDIFIILRHIFGIQQDQTSDVNEDGNVNIFDLVVTAKYFGKRYGTDTIPPSILNKIPSQNILPLGTTTAIVGVETDERATCRHNPQHTKEETGLQDDSNYLYFVQCRDEVGNLNSTNYLINFSVGS
jgi:hypothetical protein